MAIYNKNENESCKNAYNAGNAYQIQLWCVCEYLLNKNETLERIFSVFSIMRV